MKYLTIIILIVLSFSVFSQTYKPNNSNWLYNARGAAMLYYNTDDSTFYPVQGDAATNTMTITEFEHHEIHEGDHYYINGYSTLGSGDSLMFAVTTPDTTKWTHSVFSVISSGILETRIHEDATVTARTAITPHNNNRNIADASVDTVGFVTFAQISSFGTCIDSSKVGSGGAFRSGGEIARNRELVYKQNSTYIIILISGSATNYTSYSKSWYEHTNEN